MDVYGGGGGALQLGADKDEGLVGVEEELDLGGRGTWEADLSWIRRGMMGLVSAVRGPCGLVGGGQGGLVGTHFTPKLR